MGRYVEENFLTVIISWLSNGQWITQNETLIIHYMYITSFEKNAGQLIDELLSK